MNSEKSSIWGREVHYVLKPLGNLFISKEFIRHSGRDERALKKSFTITALDYVVLYFIFWSSMDRLENVKTKIT